MATTGKNDSPEILREPAEVLYKDQLAALIQNDTDTPPASWRMSPKSVLKFIMGSDPLPLKKGRKTTEIEITPKFFGDVRLVERAIITLASERALLLVGEPGTGKSWLSENLVAAISGNSTLTIQGTAGTTEEHIKYTWNIARVIAEGYAEANRVPSPTMVAMAQGGILRFEEITRCVPDVQDSLVSILSDKNIAVPELPSANMVWARPGFNILATANSRDQGVNELSSALKRRINYIHIPVVTDQNTEEQIILQRTSELGKHYNIETEIRPGVISLLATVFRELREGRSKEGIKLTTPGTTLSTAESISVMLDASLYARYYGDGVVSARDIASNLIGVVVKEDPKDLGALKEYVDLVVKSRRDRSDDWNHFFESASQVLKQG